MRFNIFFSRYFETQLERIKDTILINKKLDLLEINPFRFKSVTGKRFVFAIKIRLNGYKRLIYEIEPSLRKVFVFGLFERRKDYKDFEKFYKKYLKNNIMLL